MEDLPIGSEIVLKVVESETEECNGCFFDSKDSCGVWRNCSCASKQRSDHKNVIFKEVKE